MKTVTVKDAELQDAAGKGMDEFVQIFANAITKSIGGELTAANMGELNADQITLIAYIMLRDEVMDGGFVQLIHNGYGGFFFHNPFGKAMREWGLDGLATLMNKAKKMYFKHHEQIEKECTDEEFMALFEKFAEFDDLDDAFVENEEEWTSMVAHYIDGHIGNFAEVIK